ncbi:hypothetical protein GGF32_006954 [Allomyces javanicus]|nr:hypothetical protein GGF32_006954 [Allomyces javanicus]
MQPSALKSLPDVVLDRLFATLVPPVPLGSFEYDIVPRPGATLSLLQLARALPVFYTRALDWVIAQAPQHVVHLVSPAAAKWFAPKMHSLTLPLELIGRIGQIPGEPHAYLITHVQPDFAATMAKLVQSCPAIEQMKLAFEPDIILVLDAVLGQLLRNLPSRLRVLIVELLGPVDPRMDFDENMHFDLLSTLVELTLRAPSTSDCVWPSYLFGQLLDALVDN